MDAFLLWIEDSALSNLIRGSESMFAFPAIITLHTVGMAFLAGGSAAIDLRIMGFAPGIPLKPMERFFPLLWVALMLNVVTGILLVIAYATKALTNPVFYVKLCLVVLALWLVHRIGETILRAPDAGQKVIPASARMLALASLGSWVAVITAGRLLAYTNRWELLGIKAIH